MAAAKTIFQKSNRRIAALALAVFALDQFTKWLVLQTLGRGGEKVVIDGFFKFVHRGNTGAAWSLFSGNNATLAIVALFALVALVLTRHHFDSHTLPGRIAFGLIFGGIAGNLPTACCPAATPSWISSTFTCNSAMATKSVSPPSTSPTAPFAPAWRWFFSSPGKPNTRQKT